MFAFLSYLLKPLDRYRWGKYARLILIGLCIWCYVFLTGLAPPILRAGIMLSFYLLSLAILRQQDNVNTLFASAFLILLLDCRMLFTIGFQLSYAAVFGIFTLYPLALRLYQVKHVVVNSLLKFCYLSLSAQLFTAPLALYYFNQFPTYFLLGNLCVALPIVGIMYAGITLALIPMESVAKPIAWLMERLITVLLEILHALEGLPSAVQQGIAFEEWQALWAYALLLLFIYVCRTASKRAFWLLHMLLLGFIVVHITGMLQQRRFAGVKVYNMQKEVAIAYIRGGAVHVLSTADSLHQPSLQYHVHPDLKHYCALDAVFFTHMDAHRNVRWQLGDFTMLVVQDEPEGMDLSAIDLVLWRNNPKFPVHPSAWSSAMHIMDGSNNAATLSLWQGEMQALDMPYYKLKNNFAYVWTRKH